MNQAPVRLVESLQKKISDIEIEFHRAYWDSQVDASETNERRRSELELELRRVKGDAEALHAVNDALAGEIHDPVVLRLLEVLRLALTGNQMDEAQRARIVELSSAVESEFAQYRPVIGGREVSDNDIDRLLRTSGDETERRAAWEASKEIGARVADRVRELARARNEAARKLGFADFYRMSLQLQEFDEGWLFALFDQLEDLTREPFLRWKEDLDARLRARFGVERLYPWHYADPFFQQLPPEGRISLDPHLKDASPPELALVTFTKLGIDISSVLDASDLYPRANKCQHAFCLDVDRTGRDIRILANVTPGEQWSEIMLHESGHAAYDLCIDQHLPYLLRRAAHTFVTEAAALLSGRFVRDPQWLSEVANVRADEADAIGDELRRSAAASALLFARWCLAVTQFERDLYADPEADLDQRWWELVHRFQGITAPEGRSRPDWAAKIHIAVAPVYYHNYLLGDVLASQLQAAGGSLLGPSTGEFLTERVFRHGNLLRWDGLIEEATGKPLDPQDFVEDLAVVL